MSSTVAQTVSCFVFIASALPGKRIGIIVFGEEGYYPTDLDHPIASAQRIRQKVERMNEARGISIDVAESMYLGSMFGWLCPAADRARHFAAQLEG